MPTLLKLFGNIRKPLTQALTQPLTQPRPRRIWGLVALLGGLAMGCTVAPVNAWWLAWVALAPLWVVVRGNSGWGDRASSSDSPQSPLATRTFRWGDSRQDFFANCTLLPILWGMGYHGLALSWIVDLHPLTWMGIPWLGSVAIALFAWVFITLWGAAIPLVWSLGFSLIARLFRPTLPSAHPPTRPLFLILTGTALWCATETLWSHSPLYWTSLALTQSPHNLPILHLGQLSGPTAVTAAIVAVNGLLAESFLAWRTRPQRVSAAPERNSQSAPHGNRPLLPGSPSSASRYLALALALLAATHLGGWVLLRQPLADQDNQVLTVGLVQGNVPTRIKLFETGERLALERYTQGYNTLADAGVDLVVMPEGAFPWVWVGTAQQAQHPLYQAVLARGVPAIVGTVGWQERRMTQSLFAFASNGEIAGHYDKVKLVPLGEYIPFEEVLGRVVGRLSLIEDSMHPGHLEQRFDTPVGRAIAAICYESAFSYLFRQQAAAGGEFILTASNNDPYPRRMMLQHHAQDVMRAIESDRWAVRVTNTGLSGIVNPHGETVWLSGDQTLETHAAPIYRRQSKTPYVRWGDWLLVLLAGLSAIREAIPTGIPLIASWLRRSRNSPKSPPS